MYSPLLSHTKQPFQCLQNPASTEAEIEDYPRKPRLIEQEMNGTVLFAYCRCLGVAVFCGFRSSIWLVGMMDYWHCVVHIDSASVKAGAHLDLIPSSSQDDYRSQFHYRSGLKYSG